MARKIETVVPLGIGNQVFHIAPIVDVQPHQTEGADCWCMPEVRVYRVGLMLQSVNIIHNRLMREDDNLVLNS